MSKTPVSILHELMQRRGIVPHYDLLPSEGIGTHMPTFYYKVTAGDVCKVGKARSKKNAKQEAAKLALETFATVGIYHSDHVATPPPMDSEDFTAETINAVGILKDFCADNNIPEPEFNLISAIGPAHLRQFTVECKIATLCVSATDFTKKKAKQAAAQKMLLRLKDSLPEFIDTLREEKTSVFPGIPQEIIDGYKENSTQSRKKINWGLKISSYPKTIRKIMEENNIPYNILWKDISNEDINDLQDICDKLNLTYAIDCKADEDESFVVFVTLSTEPELVVTGIERNKEGAIYRALKQTFEFLKIMTK